VDSLTFDWLADTYTSGAKGEGGRGCISSAYSN